MPPQSQTANSVSKRRSGNPGKACLRCHKRKQRCIGFPECSNCQRARTSCQRDFTTALRKLGSLSKEELMDKIEQLESERRTPQAPADVDSTPVLPPSQRLPVRDQQISGCLSETEDNYESAFEEVGCPPTPTVIASPRRRPIENPEPQEIRSRRVTARERNGLDILPGEDMGRRYLSTYLGSLHRRLPICNYLQLLIHHQALHAGNVAPTTPSFMTFRLYMAYGIGASVQSLAGSAPAHRPDRYLKMAMKIRESLQCNAVAEVEILLWKVLFELRSSYNTEVWFTIGLAVRTAVEAGLHREAYYRSLDATTADLQRCLFWAVYATERNICWSLKRPFSLSDHDIDTALPIAQIHPVTLQSGITTTEAPLSDHSQRPLDTKIFISTIQLCRINSQTFTELHRVDRGLASVREQLPSLLDRLSQFETSLSFCSGTDHDFLQLHVKNAFRVLLEPFLASMHTSDPLLNICLEAAGSVCQIFRTMRLKHSLGYSFTMINSVFVAGTTICYILFKNPALWTPRRANDIRACSSALLATAQHNHAIRKYCDVLESIINATMNYVEQTYTVGTGSASALSPTSCRREEDHHANPADAFNKLSHTLKELQFEFPSHSYPSYQGTMYAESEDASEPCERWQDHQYYMEERLTSMGGFDPRTLIDLTFLDARWDLAMSLDGTVDGYGEGRPYQGLT